MESDRAKNISHKDALLKFFNTDSVEKEFVFNGKPFTERVAKYPKIIYQKYLSQEQTHFHDNSIVYPEGKTNIFSLRIDVDEVIDGEFEKYLELFLHYKDWITIFCCASVFIGKERLLLKAKGAGLDIQSHGYYHYVFNDYENNLYNLSRAKEFFERSGIHTTGFAAPMGKYSKELMLVLEALGYGYSSDFSFDYLNFPHFPKLGKRFSKILQVPIFPICPELLFEDGFTQAEVTSYYDQAIAILKNANLPVIIYAHTNKHFENVRVFLRQLLEKMKGDPSFYKCNMSEFTAIWLEKKPTKTSVNYGIFDNMVAANEGITSRHFFFGIEKKVDFLQRLRYFIKQITDFENIVPLSELKGSIFKRYLKLFLRNLQVNK